MEDIFFVFLIPFVLFIVAGYYLYNHRGLWMLSGYNLMNKKKKEEYNQKHDMKAISRFVGIFCFITAFYFLIFLFSLYYNQTTLALVLTIAELAIGVIFMLYVNLGKRFRK